MKAFYCVGTHWDREWYEPFQEFRMWLVELIDEVMDLMERDPSYASFHLDGQTIMLEDYLEIRPEQKDRLLKHLRERRLLAGPWYNLPDEWLTSGESMVRNLARGFRICREMGITPLDFAYTPDQFGHIAALPMIMSGFGLKTGIVWRGAQDENYPAQFVWIGPDGSRMVYFKLVDKGSYAPFDFLARRPIKEADFSDASFKEYFEGYLAEEKARGAAPVVLMLDAIDHQRPDPEMPRLFKELQTRYPDTEFIWGGLDEFGRELLQYQDRLPERRGELREPVRDCKRGGQYLIVHTISSRLDIKQRNDQCQALLENWCEPYMLFATMNNVAPPRAYLEKAWEYLLKNHPHDSICGCSIDQVHRDMLYRFDQCALIGDGIIRRSLASLADACSEGDQWQHIVAHNPLPQRRKGIFDVALYFPSDYGEKTGHIFHDGLATGERYNKFHLVDVAGNRIPYQHRRIERGIECKRLDSLGRETTVGGDLYHIAVELDLPSCGMTGFSIEGTDDATRTFGGMLTGPLSASNGLVEVHVDSGGGVSVQRTGGPAFDGLFLYEDAGDCGDGWTRGIPVDDIVFRSHGSMVTTGIEENGPLRTTFRVERVLSLPLKIDPRTRGRGAERGALEITDFITIEKRCPIIKVKTVINNTVADHRLRVLFPTQCDTDVSFAETPFAVVQRDIPIPAESALWQERVNEEKAFTSFFGLHDDRGGLAVLCPAGLHEYAALDTPQRELALTLFRAFRKTVGKPEEPDGQLPGIHVVEYGLLPFGDKPDLPLLARLTAAMQTPVRVHTSKTPTPHKSFLTLEQGNAIVTAIKPADDGNGGVIRFWNPTDAPLKDGFKLDRPFKTIERCDLNEVPVEAIEPVNGYAPVTIAPGGLCTARFTWQPSQ